MSSPEFRLRFADRVQFHLFNGGIIDDRDPDGAGAAISHVRQRLNGLVSEAGNLVKYNIGQTLSLSAFNQWAAPTLGRRTYLLGQTAGHQMLRDAGLWPVTEPPLFDQHGGSVPLGYELGMSSSVAATGQTSTVYFTLDGSDPRLAGGVLNSTAQAFTNKFPLAQVTTVKARAQNDTTGEWSALTEATFVVGPVPASADNLVIAELMYHPPPPTATEAGFTDAEDFEFLRLLNIGAAPLDLTGARFTSGIAFDFDLGAVRYLRSGGSLCLVKNLKAFQARYGHSYDSSIAGEYEGNLSNQGERLMLMASHGLAIRDFMFGDSPPWPMVCDGGGPSLLLKEPWSNPDHANAYNWTASPVPGGLPGGIAPMQSYATWRALFWPADSQDSISGKYADPDGDGLNNFVEYALGLNPLMSSERPDLVGGIEMIQGEPRLTVSIRLVPGATDAQLRWQISENLLDWFEDATAFELFSTEPNVDGTATLKYIRSISYSADSKRFARFQITEKL
jgi:hypothetical protein